MLNLKVFIKSDCSGSRRFIHFIIINLQKQLLEFILLSIDNINMHYDTIFVVAAIILLTTCSFLCLPLLPPHCECVHVYPLETPVFVLVYTRESMVADSWDFTVRCVFTKLTTCYFIHIKIN